MIRGASKRCKVVTRRIDCQRQRLSVTGGSKFKAGVTRAPNRGVRPVAGHVSVSASGTVAVGRSSNPSSCTGERAGSTAHARTPAVYGATPTVRWALASLRGTSHNMPTPEHPSQSDQTSQIFRGHDMQRALQLLYVSAPYPELQHGVLVRERERRAVAHCDDLHRRVHEPARGSHGVQERVYFTCFSRLAASQSSESQSMVNVRSASTTRTVTPPRLLTT
jgi:hypothetical protein